MKRNWRIWYLAYKTPLLLSAAIALVLLLAVAWAVLRPVYNPVPSSIKKQVKFSIIYPTGYAVDQSSWKYIPGTGTLSFNVQNDNVSVVFSEQEVPLAFQDDAAAYDRFIGSLRPAANFKSRLGAVSITSFATAGDFQTEGNAGILKTHGTLLITHPASDLTENQWHDLFNSLAVSN